MSRRAVFPSRLRLTAILPLLSAVAATGLVGATPAHAATITCTVNGVPVSGSTINGTEGDSEIICPAIPRGVTVNGGGGNNTIKVNVGGAQYEVGNRGTINAGRGDDVIIVVGGSGAADGAPGLAGNTGEIYGGGGNETVTVIGGNGAKGQDSRHSTWGNCGDGGRGGIGNDGHISAHGTIAVTGGNGGKGGDASGFQDCDGGHGGDGNNDRIIGSGTGSTVRTVGGDGGDGQSTGEGGNGGHGNDGHITIDKGVAGTEAVRALGGNGGTGGRTGNTYGGGGGEGADGNNRTIDIHTAGTAYVRGGNGGDGHPGGTGGKGNDGTVTTVPAGNYQAPGGTDGRSY
ncbi:hypothetical protein SAMN05216371_8095 [Streptomyces sp. TLI_053]|uniref:hypothetical protein n=1 Tax=Streptomyces sp. TLI_053 TaxID=1855352 RepID=UPI00087A5B56|nr:hypothetical protein [Streptomyces sp. TLI_053]SDT83277.1 hypothetical protein SAMN05216371_8095 [Streptomyces sp. TLI_053]